MAQIEKVDNSNSLYCDVRLGFYIGEREPLARRIMWIYPYSDKSFETRICYRGLWVPLFKIEDDVYQPKRIPYSRIDEDLEPGYYLVYDAPSILAGFDDRINTELHLFVSKHNLDDTTVCAQYCFPAPLKLESSEDIPMIMGYRFGTPNGNSIYWSKWADAYDLRYYTKNEIQNNYYTKEQIDAKSIFEIVTTLPTTNILSNKIYILPSNLNEKPNNNIYVEYVRVNNDWEKLGEFKADIDLTLYWDKQSLRIEKINPNDSDNRILVIHNDSDDTDWYTNVLPFSNPNPPKITIVSSHSDHEDSSDDDAVDVVTTQNILFTINKYASNNTIEYSVKRLSNSLLFTASPNISGNVYTYTIDVEVNNFNTLTELFEIKARLKNTAGKYSEYATLRVYISRRLKAPTIVFKKSENVNAETTESTDTVTYMMCTCQNASTIVYSNTIKSVDSNYRAWFMINGSGKYETKWITGVIGKSEGLWLDSTPAAQSINLCMPVIYYGIIHDLEEQNLLSGLTRLNKNSVSNTNISFNDTSANNRGYVRFAYPIEDKADSPHKYNGYTGQEGTGLLTVINDLGGNCIEQFTHTMYPSTPTELLSDTWVRYMVYTLINGDSDKTGVTYTFSNK